MDNGLLPIGAFSRASFLSIKALRAYHEAGLLVPVRVDPDTGYRSYHASQLIDAAVIARLRALDLPLDRVREVVHARDPDVTARVLADHETAMRSRLAEVQRIVAELHDSLDAPATHTPVHVREEPNQHTLALRGQVTEANFDQFLAQAYPRLGAVAAQLGIEPIGPAAALYPPEIVDNTPDDVEAYFPIARPVAVPAGSGVVIGEIPAARVAVLVHAGPYATIADTYRHLGAWVAQHATPLPLQIREIYVVSFTETADTSRFRTEIHWPITPTEETS
ncbi:MerR family transcriptional regulator [Pseudonocardia sp. GCM10023141]|uniref:MerR family transcriptional regulator n=1 Tax=Pseudonocardia sp. GCM10023141 TaxID=3252653 RepID=UPI00360813DE